MIKEYNPTTPGQRGRRSLKKEVDAVRAHKSLTKPLKGHVGRSNGTITSRHRQRGAKKQYREIDFKRDKLDIPAKVATIEHDPNRGANIALLNYADGAKRYILAPVGLMKGAEVISSESSDATVGNNLTLEKIPLGVEIHNVELHPGKGGQIVRGAGTSAILTAKEGKYAHVKLPSGEVKKILLKCRATIGSLSNPEKRLVNLGKAGRKRHLGRRPKVRGVAHASPRDHPHGGSYKDNGIGMSSPKTPWGKKTRGKKTRSRHHTDKYIIRERRRGGKKRGRAN